MVRFLAMLGLKVPPVWAPFVVGCLLGVVLGYGVLILFFSGWQP